MTKKLTDQKRLYVDAPFSKVKSLGEGVYEGIVATSAFDRHGESLDIKGLDTSTYMDSNPIVLFGHNYSDPENVIGKALTLNKQKTVKKDKNGDDVTQLTSQFQLFTDIDETKAGLVSKLIKKGVLAISIGFVPQEVDGDTYTKAEMVEYSVVPVPANGQAAITARSLDLQGDEAKQFKAIMKSVEAVAENTLEGDDDTEVEEVETNEEVKTKGALQDEIDEDRMQEQKAEKMSDVWEVFWAFCDVYYSDDSQVTDFEGLLGEFITILGTIQDGSYKSDPNDDDVDDDDTIGMALKKIDKDIVKAFAEAAAKKVVPVTKADDDQGDAYWNGVLLSIANIDKIVDDLQVTMSAKLGVANPDNDSQQNSNPDVVDNEDGNNGTGMGHDTSPASNTVKEIAIPITEKGLDIHDLSADSIKQLAVALKQYAVELEEDANQIASGTTQGVSSPTVRKRKLVLRQAKKKVVTVDKMVELTLRQLNSK